MDADGVRFTTDLGDGKSYEVSAFGRMLVVFRGGDGQLKILDSRLDAVACDRRRNVSRPCDRRCRSARGTMGR
jgi:hypothetical protein